MNIRIITPAPPRSRYGNRVTAVRWSRLLTSLGHRVTIAQEYRDEECDLLIGLHAGRSYDAVRRYRVRRPTAPLVVALTGTDLYRDLPGSARAVESLRLATRLVSLHSAAGEALPAAYRDKVRVIVQSARKPPAGIRRAARHFQVCVIGHLREEKDPFRAAAAARDLPPASRVRIVHAGKAMTPEMAALARAEQEGNGRYRWLGELAPWRVRRLLARSAAMVLSSRMEGGANVVSEAAVANVPILASRIAGTVGLLGAEYPGYFEVGDTPGLTRLLRKAEDDAAFRKALRSPLRRLALQASPEQERAAWNRLLRELFP